MSPLPLDMQVHKQILLRNCFRYLGITLLTIPPPAVFGGTVNYFLIAP